MSATRCIRWMVLAVTVAACAGGDASERIDLLVSDGTVIDPASGTSRLADIAIDHGVIVEIGDALGEKYEAAQRLDVRGKYVIPGLADMHTHFGTGVYPPNQDDTTPVLARLLYYGVTTTLNLGSFQAWPARIDSLRAAMDRGTLAGPRLLAVGALITVPRSHPTTTIYSPPLRAQIATIVDRASADGPIDLAPETERATTLVRTAEDMRAEVRRLGEWGADAIKLVVESGPGPFGDDHPQMSPELISAAVEAVRPYGIPVLCHVSSPDELEECVNNGATAAVHAVTAGALPEGLETRMASAGMALISTASLFEGWVRYPDDPSLIDDPFLSETLTAAERDAFRDDLNGASPSSDPEDEVWLNQLRAHIKTAADAGVLIVAGTDVGNPYRFPGYGLHEEIAFYVSAGLTPNEALATATVNAATLVGDEDVWGSIREGLAADFVIVRDNPLDDIANTRTVDQVVQAGRLVDRSALPVR